ncbi:MAG: T9SS type A sorting domain-containing protein [Janthinobacterium lividum]
MKLSLPAFIKSALLGLAVAGAAQAAPFTPGNFVVAVVGDGTGSLSSVATQVSLLEYTPTGVLVQTVVLPTTASGSNHILTVSGSATSELNLTSSGDGRYLVLTGYDAAVGTTGVASTAVATVNRVVGRVAADGTVNTTSLINDSFDGNNIRAAYSANGSTFYAVGGVGGVRYLPLGNAGATTSLAVAPANIRAIGAFGGNLYVSSGSSATLGVSQIGTGLPTAAGQTNTALPSLATASNSSPYAFYFADLNPAVAGVDVAYVTDDRTATGGGIQKYSLVSGTWTLNGTIANTATTIPALRGLTGTVSNGTVTLAATAPTGLYLVSDAAGYNAAPTTTTLPAAVATAATNTAFRGVAPTPLATALATRAEASAAQLTLYPNPAQDIVTIRLAGVTPLNETAELLDLTGRVVRAMPLSASGELPVHDLPTGVYVLRVAGLTRRVVVQ